MSPEDYLQHYGIPGMKWGRRKSKVAYSTRRKAKKDAKEYARAKMFYGEGAGNRRKLIKATVNQRTKDLKGYKAEFEKNLDKQDMSKHVSAAKRERIIRTTGKTTVKTTRGLINAALGNIGKSSAAAASIYTISHATGVDKIVSNYAKDSFKKVLKWMSNN